MIGSRLRADCEGRPSPKNSFERPLRKLMCPGRIYLRVSNDLLTQKGEKKTAHTHHSRDNVLLLRACVRNALKGEKKKCSAGRKNIIAKQTGREEWVIGNLTLCPSSRFFPGKTRNGRLIYARFLCGICCFFRSSSRFCFVAPCGRDNLPFVSRRENLLILVLCG